MIAYPGQTLKYSWKFKQLASGSLADHDTISIDVKDPLGSTRVQYDSDNLTRVSTGVYTYHFTVPTDVVYGRWYVRNECVAGGVTTVDIYYFTVAQP